MYTAYKYHNMNFLMKFLFFVPILAFSYYVPAYAFSIISKLNDYHWLSYILIVPTLLFWAGINIYDVWTMPLDYTFGVMFESIYFTVILLIIAISGILAIDNKDIDEI